MPLALPHSARSCALTQSRFARYAVFAYLYIMQGIPAGFYLTALTNFFTAHGVRSTTVGAFIALIGLPWAFQFVWGPLIDRFQHSVLGRRKPWVVGSQVMALLASALLLLVADPVAQIGMLGWLFCGRSVFAALQDAAVDAMAITVTPEAERGRVNAFMRAGYLTGVGIGAAAFAMLLRDYGFRPAVLVQLGLLLTGVVLMLVVRERPGDPLWPAQRTVPARPAGPASTPSAAPDFRHLFIELMRGLLSRRSLLIAAAIILAYLSNALFLRAYNHHLLYVLHWNDTDLSVLTGTYGMVAAATVSLTGGYVADKLGARRLLLLVLAVVAAYLIGFNLLADRWPTLSVGQTGLMILYLIDPALSAAALPVLMSLCRKGIEGSQFTTYMAFVNLSDIAGTLAAGYALDYVSAPAIGLVGGGLFGVALLVAGLTRHRALTYRS